MNNVLASPSAKLDSIVNAIGCQTVKSGANGNKSFNLKIKLKNESSFKKLKLSTQKRTDSSSKKSKEKIEAENDYDMNIVKQKMGGEQKQSSSLPRH